MIKTDFLAADQPDLAIATVSEIPVAKLPRKRRQGFTVDLEGAVQCDQCGARGTVPHHLSPVFWSFLERPQLALLIQRMAPDEHVMWFAHGLVRVRNAAGAERALRERDGAWFEKANEGQ